MACPTYKATYTGLLKLFLDRFSVGQLTGVAVPLMLGARPDPRAGARDRARGRCSPISGALVPTTGLYVLDQQYDDPAAYAEWLAGARPAITALLSHPRGATA